MTTANQDIRNTIKQSGLFFWQVAENLNLNDGNFSRKLRKELSKEEKAQIMSIIEELKGTGE